MLSIDYPEPSFQTRKQEGKDYIFDRIRKKWLLLTPEEWVRQNFVQYLVEVRKYPATLIAMEKMIQVGDLKKRFDILVYDVEHRPWMMIECKAPSIPLGDDVMHQLLRYHISVPAGYLLITNGPVTYGWGKENGKLVSLEAIPEWGT